MDFLWIFNLNPYGLWIFYGMDMDLVSNSSGPTVHEFYCGRNRSNNSCVIVDCKAK